MKSILKFVDNKIFWVALLFSIPAVWALATSGFYGASDDLHIAWLHQLNETLKAGQFPPRYVPDLSFGFGYPLFNFVFPLPFYIAEIFHVVGFSLVDSIKIVFFLSIPLSFLGMYKLLREMLPSGFSFAGAVLYVYTPYRATDLYVRGAIGEIAAFAILPVILLSLIKLFQNEQTDKLALKWIGIGGMSVGLLILTHNIVSYMFLPASFLFVLVSVFFLKQNRVLFFVNSLLVYFSGLLASLFFWLPAILESSLMKYDTVFNFWDHFPTVRQLITPYFGYGASVPGPGDGMSFFIGGINLLVVVVGLIMTPFFWKKLNTVKKVVLIWSIGIFSAAIFIMNHRSAFLWYNIPNLAYFQFPWRFLTMTTFVSPLFLVVISNLKYHRVIFLAIVIFSIVLNFSFFRPQDFLGRRDDYFLNRYVPLPLVSDEYKKISEEYLRLPKNAQVRPDRLYPTFFTQESGVMFTEIETVSKFDASVSIEANNDTLISFNKYFFPGWVGEIDGQKLDITSGKPFGQIQFNVPSGSHTVRIVYKEPTYKVVLDYLSLFSFILLFSAISLDKIRSKLKGFKLVP